jgi:hypothetical protein
MLKKIVDYLGAKVMIVIDYLTGAIVDPAKLIATSFAIGISADSLVVGKLGFIAFLLKTFNEIIISTASLNIAFAIVALALAVVFTAKK